MKNKEREIAIASLEKAIKRVEMAMKDLIAVKNYNIYCIGYKNLEQAKKNLTWLLEELKQII